MNVLCREQPVALLSDPSFNSWQTHQGCLKQSHTRQCALYWRHTGETSGNPWKPVAHTNTHFSFPEWLCRVRTGLNGSNGPRFLFRLQTRTVPLLTQPPPLQVTSALQTVHSGAQEDDDAAWHQLGGHPTLVRGKKEVKPVCKLSKQIQCKTF